MSVIWSGITEGGAIVPVQVDESGKVIATAELKEELWTQNGNQLIPVNASNDIATYGKIVLGRASSGTSTLQSPPDAAGEVFTFPKTGGTLAIESDTPTPSGLSPFAYCTVLNDKIVNSFNVKQVTYTSEKLYQCDFENRANTSSPSVAVSGKQGNIISANKLSDDYVSIGVYQKNSSEPVRIGDFSVIVFEAAPSTKENMPVLYEDPKDDPFSAEYVPES